MAARDDGDAQWATRANRPIELIVSGSARYDTTYLVSRANRAVLAWAITTHLATSIIALNPCQNDKVGVDLMCGVLGLLACVLQCTCMT